MAAAVRARFIEHLRMADSQTRCRRLGRRRTPLLPPVSPLLQAPGELGLQSSIRRPIVSPTAQGLGEVLLIHARIRGVVRVLVALAVAEILHESGGRVAD